jgi:DNA-binding Lrp family transcriptional regulator
MIRSFVFIEAEPARVQELLAELHDMKLASSVIREVYGVSGRWDLVAVVESPDLQSLGD